MSLSHAGPLNNAQRSSQNKPLPRLLAPPHLSPLSGASPTQATRTKKKKKEYSSTPLPLPLPPLPLSLTAVLRVAGWAEEKLLIKATSCLFVILFSRLPVLRLILHFFEINHHALRTWNAAATSRKALGRSDWSETLMDGGVWFASCYL